MRIKGMTAACVCAVAACAPGLAAQPSVSVAPAVRQRCIAVLEAGLASKEFWPSMHAAEALTQSGRGLEVLRALKGRLEAEKDDQHRCGLAREQVRAGKRELAKVMLDILANKQSKGRVHAAESLYKVREIGDGKLLRAALDEGDAALEMMAAAALVRGGDRSALARVRKRVASTDNSTARLAAWVLGRLGDQTDVPALQKLAKRKMDALGHSFVINALAQLGAPGALDQVVANLKHADPNVRRYAAQTIGDCRAAQHLQRLIPMLSDDDLDTRIRAAQAILLITAGTHKVAP